MRPQTIRQLSTGAVGVVLVTVLTLMVNWLGGRHYTRYDWTTDELYTLSEKSRNILDAVEEEIRVVVFMTPETPLYRQVKELLDRYEASSPKISVETIDPDRERVRTQQLAEEFGISMADTVVFSAGERSKYVTSADMADYDYSGMQMGQGPTLTSFKAEEQFTSAIQSLVQPEVPDVFVVTGHGEARLAPGAGQRALSQLAEGLRRENMNVGEASLLTGEIPAGTDVLIIAGPSTAYTEVEIQVLRSYLEGGGRALIALDPLIETDARVRETRLEAMLADFGVEVRPDLVVDPSRRLPFYDLSAVYLDGYGTHPVTEGMDGLAVLFLVTRSLGVVQGSGFSVTPLVRTSPDGWGESNLNELLMGQPVEMDDADSPGPVSVAVAVESTPDAEADAEADATIGLRLVVFGDSEFLSDGEIANAGNATLALNAMNWLAARDASLGIPPRDVSRSNLYLADEELRTIFVLVVLVMPLVAVVLGVIVWRRRRR
jgi:ABC-type uncharacterized transport system involved in gliding motility auxiliary subunit